MRWQEEPAIAALLARAFVDDPLVNAIYQAPPAERLRRMWWSFRVAVRSHYLGGQPAWTVGDDAATPVGVVLVTRARGPVHAYSDLLFTIRSLFHIGWHAAYRGVRAATIIAARAPSEPFTYLRTLGVDPDRHGHGFGSLLVEHMLRAAPPMLPVYLETAKERNLAFYERHGFRCAGEFRCLGVPVWRLIRPAGVG